MKIDCETQELSSGMQAIQSAMSGRVTLPILLNFLLEADKDGGIRMMSTDLTMGMRQRVKASVGDGGSITIPAKKFAEILKTMPQGKKVKISLGKEDRLTVQCGRSRFVLNGTPKAEYPVLPEFENDKSFDVVASEMATMLRLTGFSTSEDETRYVLNGLNWSAKDGVLDMAGTDGRRLAYLSRKILPEDKNFNIIVPNKMVSEMITQLTPLQSSKVAFVIDENRISLKAGDSIMTSRLVEGSYPDYSSILPKEFDKNIEINREEFFTMLRQAALCMSDKAGNMGLDLEKGKIRVSAQSQTVEFEDEIAIEYDGPDLKIGFNPSYMVEGMKVMESEKVKLSFNGPNDPALITPVGDELGYKYVVMPMRR